MAEDLGHKACAHHMAFLLNPFLFLPLLLLGDSFSMIWFSLVEESLHWPGNRSKSLQMSLCWHFTRCLQWHCLGSPTRIIVPTWATYSRQYKANAKCKTISVNRTWKICLYSSVPSWIWNLVLVILALSKCRNSLLPTFHPNQWSFLLHVGIVTCNF